MDDLRAARSSLPLRFARTVKEGELGLGRAGVLYFQCGNCLVEYDYKSQVQKAIQFPSGVRLDAWSINKARGILACAVRGLGKSVIQLYDCKSLDVITEFHSGDPNYVTDRLVFSTGGFRLLSLEAFPGKNIHVWKLGCFPSVLETDKLSQLEATRMFTVTGSHLEPIEQVSFNPCNHQSFVVFTSREITQHILCDDHGAEDYYSNTLYDLRLPQPFKGIKNQILCHVWGPDHTVYCGLRSGELIALCKEFKGHVERPPYNPHSVLSPIESDSVCDSRPNDYINILNMLKHDMAEPATGLFSELDLRGTGFLKSEKLNEALEPGSTSLTEPFQLVYSSPKNADAITAMTVQGSHLLAATTRGEILVFEFLNTSKKGSPYPIVSPCKGRLSLRSSNSVSRFILDDTARYLLCVFESGLLGRVLAEDVKKACSELTGAREESDFIQELKIRTAVHHVPISMTMPLGERAKPGLVTDTWASFPMGNGLNLIALRNGTLRVYDMHGVVCEHIVPSPLAKPSGPADSVRMVSTLEAKQKETSHLFHSNVLVSPDGRLVACGSVRGVVTVLEAGSKSLKPIFSARLHKKDVKITCLSPTSERLATISEDGTLVVINMLSRRAIARWDAKPEENLMPVCAAWINCTCVAVAMEGKQVFVYKVTWPVAEPVVTVDLHHQISVFLPTSQPDTFYTISRESEEIHILRLSNDNHLVAVKDEAVASIGFVATCAAISPNSCMLVIGGEEGQIKIFVSEKKENQILKCLGEIQAHDPFPLLTGPDQDIIPSYWGGTLSLNFATNGPSLMSFGASFGCFVWDLGPLLSICKSSPWWNDASSEAKPTPSEVKTPLDTKIPPEANIQASEPLPSQRGSARVRDALEGEWDNLDELYCPLTMGANVCETKLSDGVCSECGIRPPQNEVVEEETVEAADVPYQEEDVEYCPLTMGALVCESKMDERGYCMECGISVKKQSEDTPKSLNDGKHDINNMESIAFTEASPEDEVDTTVTHEVDINGGKIERKGAMGIKTQLDRLKSGLDSLLADNNSREEIDKLGRFEFIIDKHGVQEIEREAEERARKEGERMMREQRACRLVMHRIRQETQGVYVKPKLVIEPFKAPIDGVSNYPVLKVSNKEEARIRKIKQLRLMATLEQHFMVENLLNDISNKLSAGSPASPTAGHRSPSLSPMAASPTSGGFHSDIDYAPEPGWPAERGEWEAIGVLPEDPLTVAAAYVRDVNVSRLNAEANEISKTLSRIPRISSVSATAANDGKASRTSENRKRDSKSKREGSIDSAIHDHKQPRSWRMMSLGELPDDPAALSECTQHPASCIARQNKVQQIAAIRERTCTLAAQFNEAFDAVYKDKHICHEMLLEHRRRIFDVREELVALANKCRADQASADARRDQLMKWRYEREDKAYKESVIRARIMGKKIPTRRVRGDSPEEREEQKKHQEELDRRREEEQAEHAELTREIFSCVLTDDEIPDLLFKVTEEEINKYSNHPYASDDRRRRKGANGQEKSIELDKEKKRALQDFMDGVLRKPGMVGVEVVDVEREEWMLTTDPHDMTPEQKQEVATLDEKEAKQRGERAAKRREVLEQLRKLYSEIHSLLDRFDKKLRELADAKFHLDQVLERHNYLCASLVDSMSADELGELASQAMEERLDALTPQRRSLAKKITVMERRIDAMKSVVSEATSMDSKEAKHFRKEFEKMENYEHLNHIFRRRSKRRRLALVIRPAHYPKYDYNAAEAIVCQASSIEDWFASLRKLAVANKGRKIQAMEGVTTRFGPTASVDIEGVPLSAALFGESDPKFEEVELEQPSFDRFLRVRVRKIFAEQRLAVTTRILTTFESTLARLVEKEGTANKEAEALRDNAENWEVEQTRNGMDNHITVEIPQGLVEASEISPMSGLSSWNMLDRGVVEAYNAAILEEGDRNFGTLKQIVHQYKLLRAQMWRGRKLTLTLAMAEADTREVQLMRVTKDLQALIKSGGSGQKNREQVDLVARKMQWNEKVFEKRIEEKRRVIEKILTKHKRFVRRNHKLTSQLREIRKAVGRLEKVRGDKDGDREGKEVQDEKMRLLGLIKRLQGVSKVQREDIQVLRKEVDRLQRKAFPMFDKAFGGHRGGIGTRAGDSASPGWSHPSRKLYASRKDDGDEDLKLPYIRSGLNSR